MMHVYRQQLRRLASNFSTAVDGCPNREFAKRYPAAASQVLTVPPFKYDEVLIANPWSRDESLEQYLEWRGWNINSALSEHNLSDDVTSEAAIGLLSHPLTFPLTLARHLTKLMGKKDAARLCCVGARAECTLPDKYWRELLIATLTTRIKPEIGIDFVGPDVPPQLKSKTITLDNDDGTPTQLNRRKLTMTFHPSYLHEVVLKILKSQPDSSPEKIKNAWDGFVLFNPGLGHPNLLAKWKHTLKFMIGTGKPILFTAHSTIDAKRDQLVLEKLLADCDDDRIVQYESNVFASRMEFVDPFSKDHVLSPNHSVFLLE